MASATGLTLPGSTWSASFKNCRDSGKTFLAAYWMAFWPTAMYNFSSLRYFSWSRCICCSNFLKTELLKDPANPLSEEIITNNTFLTGRCFKNTEDFSSPSLICASKSSATKAYGREASAISWDLRILVAATISMALVILLILATDFRRFFKCWTDSAIV